MLASIKDRDIWVVYAAIVLLGIGYGISISVLAVHLDAQRIPKLAMGGLAAAFALGIATFSLPAGWSVERLGVKTTLATALGGYALCVTSFPFLSTLTTLSVARFFDGAFSVGVWVAAETALLARSDRANKGFVMSLYAIAVALGYVIGPLLASLVLPRWGTASAFLVAGGFASASMVVVLLALRNERADRTTAARHGPAPSEAVRCEPALLVVPSTTTEILWRVKTSCFGTFAYGYFQASVVLFLPLYLIADKSVPPARTVFVTAFFAAGMLAVSTWAGRLGDRHGHLRIMRALAAIGAAMVASFVFLPSFTLMCAAVFVAGATLASISPVSLALQGVVTPHADLGRANAYYNAAYAVGMLVGPPVSGVLFTRWGGAAMLFHLAALWAVFVAVATVFASDDPNHTRSRRSNGARLIDS